MQSPRGEGEGGEGRDDTSSPGETDQTAEDSAETGPPTQQSGADTAVQSFQPHPEHSPDSPTVPENVTQVLSLPQPSNLNTSEDMQYQEPQAEEDEEEEEFVVLDPEHPLVKRQQDALSAQLSKQLERINLALKEKLAMEKDDANFVHEIGLEMFGIQENLARFQSMLEERHRDKEQADGTHRQALVQLEEKKSQNSLITSRDRKAKAYVSQLQAEIDNLMLHLVFTQAASDDLQSNVKAMKNMRRKAGDERSQAETEKLKQDLYVERLTKDIERLTQEIAMYEAQASAQADETEAAKQALSEAEMEMESLVVARKQLLQQWSSSLVGMRRRDEAFSAMQDAVRNIEHQVTSMDREMESYRKSTTKEQERNEALTMQLNWSQSDGASSKKLIAQKQSQQEALQAHYSTRLRTLRETERTLARLSKETSSLQAELIDQRRQLERDSVLRLELEDKIMTHMQQRLTHNKAAKYSQRLTGKTAALKKEMISQLWKLENEVVSVGLEGSQVSQHLDSLALTQRALDEKMSKYNKFLTTNHSKSSSLLTIIGQKQATITNYNKKIYEITARSGHADLSPMEIRLEGMMAEIDELSASIGRDKQSWMKQQGILIGMTQEIEANSKEMLKLQTEFTCMQQKKIRLESQIEVEHREETELEKNAKMLREDLLKLNTLLSQKGQLRLTLEQENALLETDFLLRLKEAERETIEMQMKHEKTEEEKERLLNSLVEAERQIMLWEKKTQIVRETRVDLQVGQGDIQTMKAEIHRMEVRLSQLLKQREQLLRESEATVARRETIVLRRETLAVGLHKQTTMGELERLATGLKRKIQDRHKHVVECEQVIKELQESQVGLSQRLAQQKQQLIDLCGAGCALDPESLNLQDTKEMNLGRLVSLQSQTKRLRAVCEGSYRPLSSSETVAAALHSQRERVLATSSILGLVCQDFPQHQGALRRPTRALTTHSDTPTQPETA